MTEQSPDYLPQDAKPEALRLANVALPRYKIGFGSDEWGWRDSTPSGIPSPDGAWARFEDAQVLQTGYASARLEIESLKARAQELVAQLDAVGAGGVEPLRKRECLHQIVEPQPATAQEPMFWVRLTDSGGYEGPLYRSSIDDVRKKSGAWTPLYTAPQPPAPVQGPVPALQIESLPAMAREIFCGYPPETQKEVDDVIEWFCSSIYVAMSNVQKAQPPAPIQENEPFPHDEDLLEQLYWDFDHESSKGGQDRLTFKSKLRFYAQHVARQLPAVAQDRFDIDSLVVVPRSLLGSACSAIDKKRDAPATISELRRYTVGDLAIPSQISQKPVVWRYVPSSWKSAVLTDDPEQAKLAAEAGVPVTPLYARPAPKPLWLPSDDTEGGAV